MRGGPRPALPSTKAFHRTFLSSDAGLQAGNALTIPLITELANYIQCTGPCYPSFSRTAFDRAFR